MTSEKDLYNRFIRLTNSMKEQYNTECSWVTISPSIAFYYHDANSVFRKVKYKGYEVTGASQGFYQIGLDNQERVSLIDFSIEKWLSELENEYDDCIKVITINGKKYKLINEGE